MTTVLVFLAAYVSIGIFVLINILLASSIQVVESSGFFSVASIAFAGIGAYGSAILTTQYQVPFGLAALPGLTISLAVAPMFLIPARRLKGMYLALSSLAFVLVLQVVFNNATSLTGGALGLFGIPIDTTLPLVIAVVLVASYLLVILNSSRTGRALRAMRHDSQLAASFGINLTTYRLIALELSAAMASLSGSLTAHYISYISPDMFGFAAITTALAMVVVGGVGSWFGPYIGAVVLTLLQQLLIPFPNWSVILDGVLIVAVMVIQPGGLVLALEAMRTRSKQLHLIWNRS